MMTVRRRQCGLLDMWWCSWVPALARPVAPCDRAHSGFRASPISVCLSCVVGWTEHLEENGVTPLQFIEAMGLSVAPGSTSVVVAAEDFWVGVQHVLQPGHLLTRNDCRELFLALGNNGSEGDWARVAHRNHARNAICVAHRHRRCVADVLCCGRRSVSHDCVERGVWHSRRNEFAPSVIRHAAQQMDTVTQ